MLSPHRDDEVLGCGGMLGKADKSLIAYFNSQHPIADQERYNAEAHLIKVITGAEVFYCPYQAVNNLHDFPLTHFITFIEDLINAKRPTTIFIPDNSRNQDHQVIYQAAMVAIRPHDTNWFVPNVLIYEQHEYMTPTFIPQVFVPIDIEYKMKLFNTYQTQHRGHRKADHVKHLAGLRGSQCNAEFAEAFMVHRITI